jgi:hypothetical protein
MSERRYTDREVRRIFELAATERQRSGTVAAVSNGLTLADVQGIAREVGMDPGDVARAAAALDSPAAATRGRSLGMPVAVGRTVSIPRDLTDREWEELVAELRATFGATGRVSMQGSLRQWTNGNLHACVEPAGAGFRVRFGTRKGNAPPLNGLGIGGLIGGAILGVGSALSGNPEFAAIGVLSGGGIVTLLFNALRLPRWARRRQRQMDHVAARVQAILAPADLPPVSPADLPPV